MKRIKIGILTMSDGREYLHEEYEEMNLRYQRDIAAALEATGDFEVVQGQCAIHTNAEARAEGQRLRDANVEATIFNFAIWCYPQFTAVAQNFAPGPYLLFSKFNHFFYIFQLTRIQRISGYLCRVPSAMVILRFLFLYSKFTGTQPLYIVREPLFQSCIIFTGPTFRQ